MKDGSLLGDVGCSVKMWWFILIACAVIALLVASCGAYQEVQESNAMRECVARNGMYEEHGDWVRCTEVVK